VTSSETTAPGRGAVAARRRHRGAGQSTEDRDGGYSVLEAAITLPVVFFLTMFVVQWAIIWHARGVAQAAAQEGLRTAAGYQATAAQGHDDAANFLQQVSPGALADAKVTVDRGATTVTVTVKGPVPTIIPFASFNVDASATGPIEAYRSTP
jgi:Flp pilus assembly protein TadG